MYSNLIVIEIYRLYSCTFFLSSSKLNGLSFLGFILYKYFRILYHSYGSFKSFFIQYTANGIRAIVGVSSRKREGEKKRLALYVFWFSFKSVYILHQKCALDHIYSLWAELSLVFPGVTPILFQSQKGRVPKTWSVFGRVKWCKLLTSWAATVRSSSSPWQR